MTDKKRDKKYIYDLYYCDWERLCSILNLNEKWKTLGGLMKFSTLDIQCMEHLERCNKCPSGELLTRWGLQNHTNTELFVLLSRMKHFQAMAILKPYVEEKYHKLMLEGEGNWTELLESGAIAPGQGQSPVHCGAPLASSACGAGSIDKEGYVGHNLNVMPPEDQNEKKRLYTDKIQNIENPVSVEGNDVAGPENEPGSPQIPTGARSPAIVARSIANGYGTLLQPQLSPAGIAALSLKHPARVGGTQQHVDLTAVSSPQRKQSDTSIVTLPSEYQNVLPNLDYKDLEDATNKWDKSNIIGKGGFGTVYKGVWKETDVAIKRIELPKGDSRESQEIPFQQSIRELQALQRFRHENILQLYSVCFNGNQPCLVYQFMEKGSLEDRLKCKDNASPLTWPQRYTIAKGAARGLQYLHTVSDNPLIHGDIKSANILLDSNFTPRIGDFGLAREGPQLTRYTHMKVSKVHGTRPYLPDEFLKLKKLSTKVDTYSFGVVLFELATGRRAYDAGREKKYLKDEVVKHPDIMQLTDPRIVKDPPTFMHFIDLGKLCVSKNPRDRPEMKVVCQSIGSYNQQQLTHAQVTPRELSPREIQEYYDRKNEMDRLSLSNSPQPGSEQPCNIRQFPTTSSHLQNSLPVLGQPSCGVSGNTPGLAGSQGLFQADNSTHAQFIQMGMGMMSNVTAGGRPPVSNQAQNQTGHSPKTSPHQKTHSSVSTGISSAELLLPTVLPPLHNTPLKSPTISVMPPTGSNSTQSSLSETSDFISHYSQPSSTALPPEVENSSEEQDVGNLPLLTLLGIVKSEEVHEVARDSEQFSENFPVFVNSHETS